MNIFQWPQLMALALMLSTPLTQGHEKNTTAPSSQSMGPIKGKTVRVTQAEIDLLLAAQPDTLKLDETAKSQTQAEIREVLFQRAMLERGALESGLDKDERVKLELQAARQAVLANAYSKRLGTQSSIPDKEVETEYQRAKTDLKDTEYQMRRLSFVDESKAQELIKELTNTSIFKRLQRQLGWTPAAENFGDWRWIPSQRMPKPVLEEVIRLHQDPSAEPRPVRVEGTWYVVQVQDKRSAPYPSKTEVEASLRAKLAQERVQAWLTQRRAHEGFGPMANIQP